MGKIFIITILIAGAVYLVYRIMTYSGATGY